MDVLARFSRKPSAVGFLNWAEVYTFPGQCIGDRQKLWVWDLNEGEIQKYV